VRKTLISFLILTPVLALAQPTPPNLQAIQLPTDLPSFKQLEPPPVPKMDWEGNPIRAEISSTLPPMDRLVDLTKEVVELIAVSGQENLPAHLYWHQGELGPFCHYVDWEGNDWLGWQEDTAFHWVCAYQGSLWAQETTDNRWLCYSNSNWWWTEGDEKIQWSLYREGAYYLCDANGKITDSKGEHPGELKSDYAGPFQGDSMGRQVFFHGISGTHVSGRSGGQFWSGHASPGRVYTSQSVVWAGH
jgi:hypothetical protein